LVKSEVIPMHALRMLRAIIVWLAGSKMCNFLIGEPSMVSPKGAMRQSHVVLHSIAL